MRKRALQAMLGVGEPGVIELRLGGRVQLGRLTPSPFGHVADRDGDLIARGVE